MREVTAALWERDVIPDYRDPDGLRIGLSPLSTSFAEVRRGLEAVRETLVGSAADRAGPSAAASCADSAGPPHMLRRPRLRWQGGRHGPADQLRDPGGARPRRDPAPSTSTASGWTPELEVPGDVLMIRAGERLVLSLWDRAGFEAEVGPIADGAGLAPVTLAHNVATREEVDAVLETARRAGADPVARGAGARVGRLHRLLRRPRRLPLGDRLEPRTRSARWCCRERPRRRCVPPQVAEEGLADWRLLFHGLHACYRTARLRDRAAAGDAIGAAAEERTTTPTSTCATPGCDVRLASHDVARGDRARRAAGPADQRARRAESASRPTRACLQVLEIALDTADARRGQAVLARGARPGRLRGRTTRSSSTPTGRCRRCGSSRPSPHDEPRQRFHLDVRVPPEVAPGRVEAALAAGGTLVSDERAPTFWVLADAEGNKACVTTWQGRDGQG